MKILWITDPWSTLDHPLDTTLRLIEKSLNYPKLKTYWADVRSIRYENNKVLLNGAQVISIHPSRDASSIKLNPLRSLSPHFFDQIHYRVDPPIDSRYVYPLQLLKMGTEGYKTQFVNPIEVLLQSNEKLDSNLKLTPPTLVSCDWETLKKWGIQEKKTILKPLNGALSQGVELLNWSNASEIKKSHLHLQKVSQNFQVPVLLQKYLKSILKGETRLWFLDGEVIGSLKKHPKKGDFRVSIDEGSLLSTTKLTSQENKRIPLLSSYLKKKKIRLAAIDLIDGYVTDLNFTSPGLIVQMEKLLCAPLAKLIIEKLLKK